MRKKNVLFTLVMRHDIIDIDAKIKIPEKEQDLKEQVESLSLVSQLRTKIKLDENEEEEKKDKIVEKEK